MKESVFFVFPFSLAYLWILCNVQCSVQSCYLNKQTHKQTNLCHKKAAQI